MTFVVATAAEDDDGAAMMHGGGNGGGSGLQTAGYYREFLCKSMKVLGGDCNFHETEIFSNTVVRKESRKDRVVGLSDRRGIS